MRRANTPIENIALTLSNTIYVGMFVLIVGVLWS